MRLSRWSSVWCFAFAACTASTANDPDPVSTDDGTNVIITGTDVTPPPRDCEVAEVSGSILDSVKLAANAGTSVLTAGGDGALVYTAANAGEGVTKLDASHNVVFTYPYGTVAAVDAHKNVFVAGSFSAPRDFGTGVIVPNGNVDVFLVKLSPTGDVLFATSVGECGGDSGILGLAVAADGRIAISGDAMGTIVLDGSGHVVFKLAAFGYLAFDTHGRLVIGGNFAGMVDLGNGHRLSTTGADDYDAFVARYTTLGQYDFSVRIGDAPLPVDVPGYGERATPTIQALTGVATGTHDEIAFAGTFMYDVNLFGTILTNPPSFPSGTMAGGYVAKLAENGSVMFARGTSSSNALNYSGGVITDNGTFRPGNPVAIDANGNVIVSSNTTGNAFTPYSYASLAKYDSASASTKFFIESIQMSAGYGLGVTFDRCQNIVWSSFATRPDFNNGGGVIENTYISFVAP